MSRRLAPICALAAALALSGCGGAASSTSGGQLAAVSADAPAGASLAQDLRPLHAEAVELADLVLAASPPAEVAAVVQRVQAGSRSLLADVDDQLAGVGSIPGELGALTQVELDALRAAVDDEAVRLGVDGLLRNHLAAVTRAKAAVSEGVTGTADALARRVLDEQGAALQELAAL